MKIETNMLREDYWNFTKYTMLNVPKFKRTFIMSMISIPVLVFVVLSFMQLPVYYNIGFALIGGGLADLFAIYITKKQVMNMPEKKPGILGKHVFEISEEGLKETTAVNDGFHSWAGIQSVKEDKEYFFIFIDSMIAHVIPKRSFSSNEQANEFYQKALHYWRNKNEKS